jgi:hypothetical protein
LRARTWQGERHRTAESHCANIANVHDVCEVLVKDAPKEHLTKIAERGVNELQKGVPLADVKFMIGLLKKQLLDCIEKGLDFNA